MLNKIKQDIKLKIKHLEDPLLLKPHQRGGMRKSIYKHVSGDSVTTPQLGVDRDTIHQINEKSKSAHSTARLDYSQKEGQSNKDQQLTPIG